MSKFWLGVVGTLALGVATTAVAAFAGLVPVNADVSPSRLERWIASRAFDASVARQAARRESPVAPSDAQLLAGLRIYRNNCAGCHGGPAKEPAVFGGSMFPPAPQFGIRASPKPEWQLYWIVEHGARRTAMAAWRSLLSDEERWSVVAFVHRLDSLPPAVEAAWRQPAYSSEAEKPPCVRGPDTVSHCQVPSK